MNQVTAFAAPTVHAPTIASSAILIDLSISCWTGRKLDKRASDDITSQNNASKGVANVSKKLLGDCDELTAVQKFSANARNSHYAMTMPWSDLGMRLCPTEMYVNRYQQTMTALEQEFWQLVTKFLDAYDWEVQNAQLKLGSLFNADEYPTREALASKFKFRFVPVPLPDAGDWRLDIGNDAANAMRSQYESFYGEQLNKAMTDLWQRAHEALSKMSERLDYADNATKKVFRDTLVSNVREIVDMMGLCNVTNDPTMDDAQRRLAQALEGITPDALRDDPYLRAQTKREVDAVKRIIDNLPGLGM